MLNWPCDSGSPFVKRLINRTGQSIVEISLITPLLLVALYIPFDFGMGLFTAHLTQNAVREAARIGVSNKAPPFNSAAATSVANEAVSRLPTMLASRTVTVNYYGGQPDCMEIVQVTATGTYNYFLYQLLRMWGFAVNDSISLTRATRMRYEFQPATSGNNGANTTLCTAISATGTAS
jgi:Flp pilus assembly protein TadG